MNSDSFYHLLRLSTAWIRIITAMAKRDYYDILGLSKGAPVDEVRKAYRRLARQYHPDVDKSPGAEARFKEVNEAYQTLSNPQKKQAYDQFGHAAFDQTAGFGQGFGGFDFGGFGGRAQSGRWGPFTYTYSTNGGADFEDLFSDTGNIFDMFFGGPFRRARKGRDLRYVIAVDFLDAVRGLEQEIGISGKKMRVKIPAGVESGMELRFAGGGEPGSEGVPPGDLYLRIQVNSHPVFFRRGRDVFVEQEISMIQAALGDVIEVPVIDPSTSSGQNTVKLKIPAGTQPGTEFRLRGKGVPLLRGSGRGDVYVRIRIKIPTKLSRKQREMLSQINT